MRVLNDNNQWVGDGQIIDAEPRVWDRRYGPHPSEKEWQEIQRESNKFVEFVVKELEQRRIKMSEAVLRLKCVVSSVKSVADAEGNKSQEELALSAVYSGSEANKQWSKYTPIASLTMTISNPAAFGKVLPGQFVFVDLTPTDKES
jgi:hypothetical protein